MDRSAGPKEQPRLDVKDGMPVPEVIQVFLESSVQISRFSQRTTALFPKDLRVGQVIIDVFLLPRYCESRAPERE
jgi:hypothetical protein